MSFRVSALVVVVVLELSSLASAQPQAPIRPRTGAFGNLFSPQRQFGAGVGQNQPFVNPIGPQVAGVGTPQGFAYPGQTAYPQVLPGVFGVDPQLPPTGIVGSFNNLGHWYGGNLGHWYPNGVANGRGILGYGGGGADAGGAIGPTVGGMARPGGSVGGTAIGIGAAAGMLRR